MIYISASAIKDFIVCPARFYYRTMIKERGVPTKPMSIGNVVHSIIEKYWDDKVSALENINNTMIYQGLDVADEQSYYIIRDALDTFYSNYTEMLHKSDLIEYNFKVKYEKDVYLVGKFDRIIGERSTVIDWKTGDYLPFSIDRDIQFIMYNECFYRNFGRKPANVLYISLRKNRVLRLNPDENLTDMVFTQIIPLMIKCYKTGLLPPTQLFKEFSACKDCPYKSVCHLENLGIIK